MNHIDEYSPLTHMLERSAALFQVRFRAGDRALLLSPVMFSILLLHLSIFLACSTSCWKREVELHSFPLCTDLLSGSHDAGNVSLVVYLSANFPEVHKVAS